MILFKGKVPKAKKLQKQNIKSFGVIVQTTYRLFQISHRTWDNVIEEESPIKTWLLILQKLQAVEVFSEFVQARFKFPAKFRITPLAHLLPQAADLYLTKGGIPQWRVTSSWAALKRSIDSTLKGKPIPFGISPKADVPSQDEEKKVTIKKEEKIQASSNHWYNRTKRSRKNSRRWYAWEHTESRHRHRLARCTIPYLRNLRIVQRLSWLQ